ncbi:hypothetical protein Q3G72_010725 [Acer saccharum]|nr:hypothetical protein Q3G72_010725 [Acer saccharum]
MPDSVRVDFKSDQNRCIRMTDSIFNTENSFSWQKARFGFSTSKACCKVKKCGIDPVYSEWEDQVLETQMMSPRRRKKKIASADRLKEEPKLQKQTRVNTSVPPETSIQRVM